MRRLFWIGLVAALAVLVIAGLARAWGHGTEMDKLEVARLTDRMETHCIGRFLIDMPAQAQVELGQPRIDGFDIAALAETPQEFQKRLADRETQIRAKPDQLGGNKNLESESEVKTSNGLVGKIFVHSRTVTEGTAARGLELERYRNEGVTLEALVHGAGISIDLVADYYDPHQVERLSRLVAQLVPNPDNRIPTEPGFCFDRAYFRDPLTADQGEQITMFGGLSKHPDVAFILILAAGLKPDPQGLLDRSAASARRLSLGVRMRISKLRAAPREIAGLPGEELVRTVVEDNGARVYSFWWEVGGTEDNLHIPHFLFKMNTGKSDAGPVPSSLSERTALRLWDRILASIRVRPTHQADRGPAPPTPVAPRQHAGKS